MINYDKIHEWSQRDTALAHLLRFVFHFLRHWVCKALIAIIGTIVIALLIGFQKIDILFWTICGIYVLLIIGTSICQKYDETTVLKIREELRQSKELARHNQLLIEQHDNEVKSLTTVTSMASKKIYRVARDIKHNGWSKPIRDYRDSYGFQQIAITVCKEVYELFKLHFGMTSQWVTIYQRFESKKGDYCKMIGYYNLDYQEPSSYKNEYPIKQTKKKKVEYHTELMRKSESSIAVLENRQEIEAHFVPHPESSEREQAIQQYIGLAETVCNRKVFFLLQIDTDIENGFGDSKEKIQAFAEKYLKPYAILLGMHYEADRLLEVSYNDALKTRGEKEMKQSNETNDKTTD